MDIKEVTHKIRYWLTFHTDDIDRDTMYEALEVMDTAIEEGEAYKKMWNKFKKDSGHFLLGIVDNGKIGEGFTIKVLMNILEKGVNKSV